MSTFPDAGRLAVLSILALTPPPAMAHDITAGTLVIHQPWTRATPRGAQIGGGYLTIENKGGVSDRLIGGSFEDSNAFELHAMSMDGGVMRMRPLGPLEVPAGGSVTLEPSGKHIMFTGLKHGLTKGETIAGTLVFEHAGTVPVRFQVEGIGAKALGNDALPGHGMPGMDME